MKKQILVNIESPAIITDPPQGDIMNINIEGLEPLEVVLILSSIIHQINGKELPAIIEMIKRAKVEAKIKTLSKA